jgi:hypothetical protein
MPCFRVNPFVFGLAVLLIIARSQANYRVLLSARPDHPAQRVQQDASLRCLMVSAISVQVVYSLRSVVYGAGSCGLAECWWAWVERLSRLLKRSTRVSHASGNDVTHSMERPACALIGSKRAKRAVVSVPDTFTFVAVRR